MPGHYDDPPLPPDATIARQRERAAYERLLASHRQRDMMLCHCHLLLHKVAKLEWLAVAQEAKELLSKQRGVGTA